MLTDNEESWSTEEGEAVVKFAFPYDSMSPQEWVARNGPSSFGEFWKQRFLYRDSQLQSWMDIVVDLMRTPESIEAVQRSILTEEEYEAVRADQNEEVRKQREFLSGDIGYMME